MPSTLTDAEMLPPLQLHLLPQLSAYDLGKLASTCRDMHTLVKDASVAVWQAAAAMILPSTHPARSSTTKDPILAALRKQGHVLSNLASERWQDHKLTSLAKQATWAPDGASFFVTHDDFAPERYVCFCVLEEGYLNYQEEITQHRCFLRWRADSSSVVVLQFAWQPGAPVIYNLMGMVAHASIVKRDSYTRHKCGTFLLHPWCGEQDDLSTLSCRGGYIGFLSDPVTLCFQPVHDAQGATVQMHVQEGEYISWVFDQTRDNFAALLRPCASGGDWISILNLSTQKIVKQVLVTVGDVALSVWQPEANLMVLSRDESEEWVVVSLESGQDIMRLSKAADAESLSLSVRGHLAIASAANGVAVWEVQSAQLVLELPAVSATDGYSMEWSGCGGLLAIFCATVDGVNLYRSTTWTRLAVLSIPDVSLRAFSWSPLGTAVLYEGLRHETSPQQPVVGWIDLA